MKVTGNTCQLAREFSENYVMKNVDTKTPWMVCSYVCGESFNLATILQHFEILNQLIKNGNKPFYAKDIFSTDTCNSPAGGWIQGLWYSNIIKSTGNTKTVKFSVETPIQSYDLEKEVYEWKLTMPAEELSEIVNELKKYIIDKFINVTIEKAPN